MDGNVLRLTAGFLIFSATLAMSKDGMDFVSTFGDVFKSEPMPENGRMQPQTYPTGASS